MPVKFCGSPYQAGHYTWWYGTLRDTLSRVPGLTDGDFTAHSQLAATRADLVEHLTDPGLGGMTPEDMRARLAAFAARVLGPGSGKEPGLTQASSAHASSASRHSRTAPADTAPSQPFTLAAPPMWNPSTLAASSLGRWSSRSPPPTSICGP